MNVALVNPFITSILQVLDSMAKTPAQRGAPFLRTDASTQGEITGLVTLTGSTVDGSLAYCFSREAILQIASRALNASHSEIDESVRNLVAEITSNASDGAQKALVAQGFDVEVSNPESPIGTEWAIEHFGQKPTVIIPFKTDDTGEQFFLEFCLREKLVNG